VDREKNRVSLPAPYQIEGSLQQFHQSLRIADFHADTLLWGRDLLKRSTIGHIDLPRLRDGNVALQVFSAVTKTPKGLNMKSNTDASDNITLLALAQGWPWKSINSLTERAMYLAGRLQRASRQSNGELALIQSRNDLQQVLARQARNETVVAGLLALEGAHALEGDIGNLEKLYQAGYRMIGLTHFFDNQVGGSVHGASKGGLTTFGREVVGRAESMHMIIDLSHASVRLMDDVLAVATQPVVVSHTGIKGSCDRSRNLTDKQMHAIAATGGLIGIGFYPIAVCGSGVKDIVQAFVYARQIVGIESLALGSDFDGAVPVPFDVTGLPLLTGALIDHGFTDEEIRLIMGENIIRLMMRSLPTG
jgi:microsomal dipeptidase-like Zn-dependent dipeptidase